ncbi:hypothetical protein SLOPH_812 [Spraguea lophii 42_110]|uniref:Uncharacterized protein n=1 Tax=Spraguea lophii (strain 42_110) TaxID=1358809 RepID=S7W918_SPRLO|nr:hypothetical protein SLOPH_812 [Spraguea lophii 42_110]
MLFLLQIGFMITSSDEHVIEENADDTVLENARTESKNRKAKSKREYKPIKRSRVYISSYETPGTSASVLTKDADEQKADTSNSERSHQKNHLKRKWLDRYYHEMQTANKKSNEETLATDENFNQPAHSSKVLPRKYTKLVPSKSDFSVVKFPPPSTTQLELPHVSSTSLLSEQDMHQSGTNAPINPNLSSVNDNISDQLQYKNNDTVLYNTPYFMTTLYTNIPSYKEFTERYNFDFTYQTNRRLGIEILFRNYYIHTYKFFPHRRSKKLKAQFSEEIERYDSKTIPLKKEIKMKTRNFAYKRHMNDAYPSVLTILQDILKLQIIVLNEEFNYFRIHLCDNHFNMHLIGYDVIDITGNIYLSGTIVKKMDNTIWHLVELFFGKVYFNAIIDALEIEKTKQYHLNDAQQIRLLSSHVHERIKTSICDMVEYLERLNPLLETRQQTECYNKLNGFRNILNKLNEEIE